MDSELLCRAGRALYASDWITAMALDMAVDRRVIRRMAQNENAISDGFVADVLLLCWGRLQSIREMRNRTRPALQPKLDRRIDEIEALTSEIRANQQETKAG